MSNIFPVVAQDGGTRPPVLLGLPIQAKITRHNAPVFYVQCDVGRRKAKAALQAIGYMVLTPTQERRHLASSQKTELPAVSSQSRSEALAAERTWMSR